MPYIYEDTLQGESRNALTVPSSIGDVLSAQFQQGYEENPIMALKRLSELGEAQVTGPRVSAQDARTVLQAAGMEHDITVSDAGITRAALNTLIERKRVEKRRQEIFARSEGGLVEGAARFGVAVGATLTDPLSFGLNFVPVVGQTRYARWLNSARSIGTRIAIRGAVGAAEGAVGAAIAEVPIYAMRTQEQADYDMADSLLNVAFGGVIGAGLHTTVGSIGELISRRMPSRAAPATRVEPVIGEAQGRAAEPLPTDVQRAIFDLGEAQRRVESMAPEARQAALRAAVGQAVEGQAIDVERIVSASMERDVSSTPVSRIESPTGERSDIPRTIYRTADTSDASLSVIDYGERQDAHGPMGRVVQSIEVGNVAARGKGIAQRLYLEALSEGNITERPEFRSKEATRAIDALIRKGLAERSGAESPRPKLSITPRGRAAVAQAVSGQSIDVEPVLSGLNLPTRPGLGDAEPEFRIAREHADAVLAREAESGTEANLKAAEEEADLAVSEATELTKRLGVDMKEDTDFAAVMEGVEKAERWARVAELATVCLVRGG